MNECNGIPTLQTIKDAGTNAEVFNEVVTSNATETVKVDSVGNKHKTLASIDNMSEVATEAADKAEQAANAALAVVNYKGPFVPGVTNAVEGESYFYAGSMWACLSNTSDTPLEGNSNWYSLNNHSSMTNRDAGGAHPASAITLSDGDDVQGRLQNSTTCFNRVRLEQEDLDQNFIINNEKDFNVLKDLELEPNRTGGTTQGGHVITERNSDYTLIENVDIPNLRGVGFGVLSYRTDGELNKGNAYKNLRFIRQDDTYIPLNTQGGLLLAGNRNNTVNGLYGENLGQFGTLEFKDDSSNNVASDVVGHHCESVVYFGQENGGLTSNNVISGVVGDNSHYSVVDYNIAQYNVVMGVMCNNDEEQASQPHGIIHGTNCKYNYTDGVMLKAYNLEAGVKVPYPIRFREGAEFNYVGCVQHSDSTFLRVSDPTSKANVVEMKCSKSINNLLQEGARPLGLKPSAARHDGTPTSDSTYSQALQQWIGSQSGQRLNMVSYVDLDGLLFSSDRFRDVAQGDASHVIVGTGRVGTKYVAGAGTAAKRYSNTGLRTNGVGIDIGLGYSETNTSTNTKFLTFGENNLIPSVDAELSFGSAARRGDTAFFSTGTINTSDAREKTEAMPIDEKVLDAVDRIEVTTWRWLQRVKEKGDNARWHFGPVAQQVKEAFEAEGLNGLDYGVLCYDKWDDEYIDVVNAEGKTTGERLLLTKAGDRWGVRYDQLLFLLNSALRRKINEMEERLRKLELSVNKFTS